jgi:SAM-dependent methyltransferase
MSDQAHHWSQAAARYEEEFIDPYRGAEDNPLLLALRAVPDAGEKTVGDLGCGVGPLLPTLAGRFARVVAVDFAPGMLDRARRRCAGLANVEFLQTPLTDLGALAGRLDVAVAVNSLIQPEVRQIEQALLAVRQALRPGGLFLGIVPAMDAVHYHTMLLVDRALATGMAQQQARENAAAHGEHALYDFAFGDFSYLGLRQHFWQPFEVGRRLRRAGFTQVGKARVRLSWEQFACGGELRDNPAPWDWFFLCRRPVEDTGRPPTAGG